MRTRVQHCEDTAATTWYINNTGHNMTVIRKWSLKFRPLRVHSVASVLLLVHPSKLCFRSHLEQHRHHLSLQIVVAESGGVGLYFTEAHSKFRAWIPKLLGKRRSGGLDTIDG